MELSPTSPRKPASPTKADGPPAQAGSITTKTAGSIWSSPTTSSGRRKIIFGAANVGPGYRSYCHPGNYKGQRIKLYHNNHDGTFTDVSDASGVGKPEAKGMGVVLADFNNDGWPDIAIANDSWPNFLFINKHDGTFEDVSLVSGLAASEDGRYEAGMGIDAADVDGDGWQDIYITHLDFELNRLYHNNRDGTFD
jgi:enediyne biosynthesis protein E4